MFFLPPEIWIHTLQYLRLKDIINLSKVNKYFFEITKENKYFLLNSSEGVKKEDYQKIINFIKHFRKIEYYEDQSLNLKYYIKLYPQLIKNNLKSINIKINDKYELDIIKANKNIKKLKIRSFFNLEQKYIFDIFNNLNSLTSIYIDNPNITDDIFNIFNKYQLKDLAFENCNNLKNFCYLKHNNLRSFKIINYQYNNFDIVKFLVRQKELKELYLSFIYCNYFLANKISIIGKNLKTLVLAYPQGVVNDFSLYKIVTRCKNLEILDLSGTDITDITIYYLTHNCKNIKKLSLAGTFIRDMSLVLISMYYPSIRILELEFNNITRIGIFNLLLRCKNIKFLNILNQTFTVDYLAKVYTAIIKNEQNSF